MVAAVVGLSALAGIGLLFVWIGDRSMSNRLNLNLGAHTRESAGEDAWRSAHLSLGKTFKSVGLLMLAIALVLFVYAVFIDAVVAGLGATGVVFFGSLMPIPMLIKVMGSIEPMHEA